MSDRLDRRLSPALAAGALAALLLGACQPHDPLQLPPPDGGTPCTRATAVAADTVTIAAGACNPWCVVVPVGSSVYFLNGDPSMYLLVADPALPYELQVPARAGTVTLPLAAGKVTWTAVQQPSVTVTLFVE